MEIAHKFGQEEVAAFEHEGEVAQQVLVEVVEVSAQQAEHALTEAEEVVSKEAVVASLRGI
jgi:hypothetical protein